MARRRLIFVASFAMLSAAAVGVPAGQDSSDGGQSPSVTDGAGASLYGQFCAACHGAAGEGARGWQQPNSVGELLPPPHDASGHTWRHSDGDLYRMVMDGWRDPFNRTDRLTMPAFEGVLTPEQVRAVLTFLKTMWTADQQQFQRDQSETDPFPTADE